MQKITAGVFVALQFQKCALLRLQEQIAKGPKSVGSLVEAGMLPCVRVFDAGCGDRLMLYPHGAQRVQRVAE